MVPQKTRRLLRAVKFLDSMLRYYPARRGYWACLNKHKYRLADGNDDAPHGPTYLAALEAFRLLLDCRPKFVRVPKGRPGPKPLPEWAVAAYRDGRSVGSIAREVGLSLSTVRVRLLEAGVDIRRSGWRQERLKPQRKNPRLQARDSEIRQRYTSGQTLSVIAREFGVSKQRVFQILSAPPFPDGSKSGSKIGLVETSGVGNHSAQSLEK
jgi:transposase-like protein